MNIFDDRFSREVAWEIWEQECIDRSKYLKHKKKWLAEAKRAKNNLILAKIVANTKEKRDKEVII